MKRIVTYLFLLLIVSACGVYGKVRTQESQTTADIPSWEDVYMDSKLQTLIDSALLRNVDLQIAQQRVLQARAALMNSRLSFLPSAELGLSGAQAYWNLDLFGKNLNATRASKEALSSTSLKCQSVKSALVGQVATSYLSLLLIDEQLRIGETSLDNWMQSEKVLEALKLRDPNVSEVSVLQARAQRLALESSINDLKQSRTQTQNQLCSLLGMEPCEIDRGELDDFTMSTDLSDTIPFDYVSNRPDVQAALHDYLQKSYLKQQSVSSFFPTVSITAFMNWEGIAQIVYSALQPVFENGRLTAAFKSAKAEQEIARLNYRQALVEAAVDVSNSLSAVENARQSARIDARQVELLDSAVQKTELLMQYSTVNYLEVLTARQSLLTAQQTLCMDRFNEYCGLVSLYYSIGGGAE